MKIQDYILVSFLFCLSIFLLIYLPISFGEEEGEAVVVSAYGEPYGVYDLNVNQTVEVVVGDNVNRFKIEDGYVTMYEANCTDSVCILHGPMNSTYDAIVCLPNQVIVTIIKPEEEIEDEEEIDSFSS